MAELIPENNTLEALFDVEVAKRKGMDGFADVLGILMELIKVYPSIKEVKIIKNKVYFNGVVAFTFLENKPY